MTKEHTQLEWILFNDSVLLQPMFSNKKLFESGDKRVSHKVLKETFTMDEYEDYKVGKIRTKPLVHSFIRQKCLGMEYGEYMELFGQGVEHVEGITYILHALRHHHYKLAVLTNEGEEFAKIKLEHSMLQNYFKKQVSSGNIGILQPEKGFYERALKILDARAEKCMLIDSDIKNLESAKDVGMDYIRYENPEQLEQKLRERSFIEKEGNIKMDYL